MKFLKIIIFAALLLSLTIKSYAQDNGISEYLKNVSISTYIDTYYSYDNDKSAGKNERIFNSLSPYRDQVGINIAQVSLKYGSEKIRGTFTLHYGDIPDVNWAPVTRSKFIQEANVGFSPVKNLWIDGGYFVTHIGAESFPKYNFFSSFSLQSYFEPFLQSGLKISYDFSEKFSASVHLLNGSNLFEDNNKNKSAGLQLNYSPCPKLDITYNNLIGNEQPDGLRGKIRFLNNLIFSVTPCEKVDLLAAVDYGMQEHSKLGDESESADYYGVSVSGRYKFTPKYSVSLRGDFFDDKNAIVSSIYNNRGVKANSLTVGCEYKPVENAYLRLEYRFIKMDASQKIFYENSDSRSEATLSLGFEY